MKSIIKFARLILVGCVFLASTQAQAKELEKEIYTISGIINNGSVPKEFVSWYFNITDLTGNEQRIKIEPDANGNYTTEIEVEGFAVATVVLGVRQPRNQFQAFTKIYLGDKKNIVIDAKIEGKELVVDKDKIKDNNIVGLIEYYEKIKLEAFKVRNERLSKEEFHKKSEFHLDFTKEFLKNNDDLPKQLKGYIKFWGDIEYIEKQRSLANQYNRMFGQAAPDSYNEFKVDPYRVLNSQYAPFHWVSKYVAYGVVLKDEQINSVEGICRTEKEIKYLKQKIHNPVIQQRVIPIILSGYKRNIKGDIDIDTKVKEFSHLVTYVDDKEKQKEMLADVKALKYSLPNSEIIGADLIDAEGNIVNLKDLFKDGQYVYIDLWASWCKPCRAEIPALKKLEKEYEGKNIKFVGISSDRSDKAWLKAVEVEGLHNIQLLDKDNQLGKSLNVSGIPRFVLYSPEGRLINIDAPRPSSPQIRPLLNNYIK